MPSTSALPVQYSKTSTTPRRPYEKERMDHEMKLLGEYGLKSKREIWRVNLILSRVRRKAKFLLTLPTEETRRIFEGSALLRRLHRTGVLPDHKNDLNFVLQLKTEDFLERRLQTLVFQRGFAKSIHHARVLIKQKHIRVGRQVVDVPSFIVRVDSQKYIDFAVASPFGGGRPGRVMRRTQKRKGGGGDDDLEEDI